MSHPFTKPNKPQLPPILEIAGWFILGLMFGMLAMTTGCRHCEYTASAEATHSDGAEHYTARVEIKNNTWSLAN